MTMVERPSCFVFFHPPAGAPEDDDMRAHFPLDDNALEYLRAREQAERAAAKQATSTAARRVHQELAQHFARQAERYSGVASSSG